MMVVFPLPAGRPPVSAALPFESGEMAGEPRTSVGPTLQPVRAPASPSYDCENTNGSATGALDPWDLPPPSSIVPPPPSSVRIVVAPRREAQPEDADLVRAVLGGDKNAEIAIWRRYVPLVRSKLGRSIGGQDVEDHVQEVFLRLFEYLPQLRDPAALRSFLIGITLRIAGTELRRRRCRWWLTLTATGELPEPCTFEDEGETRQVVSKLHGILTKLTPHSCRFFELRFVEERELSEVADAMSVSLATAKRHLARVSARVYAMADREPALAGYMQAAAARWNQ